MSVYVWCPKHGERDDDVDNPSECPECLSERLAANDGESDSLRKRVRALEAAVRFAHWQLTVLCADEPLPSADDFERAHPIVRELLEKEGDK